MRIAYGDRAQRVELLNWFRHCCHGYKSPSNYFRVDNLPEEQQYQWAGPLLAQYSIISRHTLDAVPVLASGLNFHVDCAKQLFQKTE